MAESATGGMLSTECASAPKGEGDPVTPEDLGRKAAMQLLEEIFKVYVHFD